MRLFISLTAALFVTLLAGCAGHSHYAGLEGREIKALSAQEIDGLRQGRGMSLALAAELNGYPGPLHVLELGDRLALTGSQRSATQALYDRMKAAAVAAGSDVISAERELDRLFASRTIDEAKLDAALARVANAQARLRGAHLQAHLEQLRILTPEQVRIYNQLRGYRS
ncbi:Spy/CpxP family protein refolding chaperone [Piscinibacter sakaiensis]|uniref:Spy/CpxP family protein refolding chaperone n=1 Tax=Piscinibacter sakaiensis TaxID=1547922 RepID=UPI003AB0F26F